MNKVAIIIPTMNRPDFILRQLRFYELTKSPHPVYLSDSSNKDNAEKIKEGIKKFKNFEIIYQWAPPGKDHLYQLLPLVKEKYCIQMGDDDIMIPKTLSECADFLEEHPDYATCIGKQVNIRFRKEDYDKPYGIVGRETRPHGRSIEDEDMLMRVKNFWSNPFFICFMVRRTETERLLRNITKAFSLMDRMLEFLLVSILLIYGKSKTLNKLGYVMQVSDNRYGFIHNVILNMMISPDFMEKWKICEDGFSEIILEMSKSEEESRKTVRWIFTAYLANQFSSEVGAYSNINTQNLQIKKGRYGNIINIISKYTRPAKIFNKIKSSISPTDRDYLDKMRKVKRFLAVGSK